MLITIIAAGAVGLLAGWVVAKDKNPVDSTLFTGKPTSEAAAALLDVAEKQAGIGSWELIALGRVYYLSGQKEKGQALFERATAREAGVGDWRRLAKVYIEAGELERAAGALQKALAAEPKDSKALAELGAVRNLAGDRAKAEEMFAKSFEAKPDEFWNTLNAAASYLGVKPQ
jgi:tetratricopeptide (TPR) repeat protein